MRMSQVVFLSKEQPVVVKPDLGMNGEQVGEGFEYRQGDDYVIAPEIEATYLHRMGYEVIGEGFTIALLLLDNGVKPKGV